MLWILDVAGLRAGLAAWGPRVAGVVSLLCSSVCFFSPWRPGPPDPWLGRGRDGLGCYSARCHRRLQPIGGDGSCLHLADSCCQNTLTTGGSIITRK